MARRRPPTRQDARRCVALAAVGFLVLAVWPSAAMAQESPSASLEPRFERLLVGSFVGSRESETFDVLRDQDVFYVPLAPFLNICGCERQNDGEDEYILTPLGRSLLPTTAVVEADGVRYVSERFLASSLATDVEFVDELYAIRFRFPWTPGQLVRADNGARVAPRADVTPAPVSLSSARVSGRHVRGESGSTSALNSLFHGRVGGGRWRLAVDQTFATPARFREYAWTRIYGQNLVLAGHQRVNLHPLLASVEMTGLQGAWTNQPLEAFSMSAAPTELLPRSLRSATTITGRGPAAGRAELRIDGVVVAVRTINLSGVYEFVDVNLPSRQSSRIEVYVYERFNRAAPIEIHDHTRGVSDQLLSGGALVVMAGGGRGGNYVEEVLNDRESAGASGFVQSRYGINDRITIEAAALTAGDRRQLLAGMTGSFGRNFVGSAAVSASGGTFGWDLDVQGYFSRWQVTARSQRTGAGYNAATDSGRYDHYAEVMFRPFDNLDVGLVGASRKSAFTEAEYVLPSVSWQPTARTWLRAHPDTFGRYRFDFSWAVDERRRLTVGHIDGFTNASLTATMTSQLALTATAEWAEQFGNRQTVQASWVGHSAWQPGFVAGIRSTRGKVGGLLGAQATFGPGILVSALFENDPRLNDPLNRRDPRITLRLHTDLAFAGGQVLNGSTYALSTTRGALGGTITADGPARVSADDLAGLPVIVNGRALTRTQRGGRFFVGNLRPGVYNVEIDPEGLPIEFNLKNAALRARVEPGAVTATEFYVTQEFGFAGRVLVEDNPFAGALVEVLDHRGEIIQSARTDRFGLYRFDGLPIGTYRVRLSSKNAPTANVLWPSREVQLDDFLFGQDLELRRTDIRELSIPDELSGQGGQGSQGSSSQQQQQQSEEQS